MPTDINTITAWCVIISTIVSALTGFFIVQTFQLQAKVAADQSEIKALEEEKALMEKRPLFFAARIYVQPYDRLEGYDHFQTNIKLQRNDIYDYRLELENFQESLKSKFEFTNFRTMADGLIEGTIITIAYKHHTGSVPYGLFEENFLIFTIKITYTDIIGYTYTQRIDVFKELEPISYPPIIPKLWKKVKRDSTPSFPI